MNGISLPSGCHHCDHVGLLCSSLPSVLCHKVARSTANLECWETAWDMTVPKIIPLPPLWGKYYKISTLDARGSFPNSAPGPNQHHQKRNNKIPSFQLKPPHAFSPGLREQRWWLHWVMATGLKHLCRGNPMPPLARTQKNRCHIVAGGHQEPDVLLLFFWMSSTHGVKEGGGQHLLFKQLPSTSYT